MNKPATRRTRRPAGTPPASATEGDRLQPPAVMQPGQHVARYLEQVQRIATGSLQAWSHDVEVEREELRSRSSPQDWLSLQSHAVTEPWMRAGELGSQMLSAWLDLQAGLARDAEMALAAWLQPWAGRWSAGTALAPALGDGPLAGGPAYWLRAWLDAPRLMLDAIGHDLQDERARPAP